MKKIICRNCGSNDIDIKQKYYECNYCHTKYKLDKEMQKEEVSEKEVIEKEFFFKSTHMLILGLFIMVLLFSFYFIWNKKEENNYQKIPNTPVFINNSHAQIGTQSIVINNYPVEKKSISAEKEEPTSMNYWNIVLKKKNNSYISALTATKFNTYIMIANNQFIELDSKGNKIWSKKLFLNYYDSERKAITVGKNYIFSYGDRRHGGKTVIFDAQKKIKKELPIHFHSLVPTNNGFVGVTNNELKSFNLQGKELWSKSLNRIPPKHSAYNEVVKLTNNTFVELGIDRENILWISNYKEDGSLSWQHKTSTYKTFIKNVVATSDGGFIISAGRYIKIFKYNSQGELEWSSNKSKYRKANSFSIIEAKDGYIHLSRLPNGFAVSKLDYDGNILWEEKYQGKKRILLNGITKAFDGGYLLGITNELGYSWLVKMSEDGEIKCDFDDERYRFNPNTKLLYSNKTSRKDKVVTLFRKTGGNCNRVALSSNEKYLYATALAGGFYIFDVSNPTNPKEISQFSKSKTKFHFYENGAYGAVSKSGPALQGDYDFNRPLDFIVSSDDKRAYIVDIIHGFYILDIEDKQHPKLLASFKNLKATSLAFAHGEKEVLVPTIDIAKGELTLISIDVNNPKKQHKFKSLQVEKHLFDGFPLYDNYERNPLKIITLASSDNILLSYRTHLLLFNTQQEALINETTLPNRILNITLSPNKEECYVSLYNGTSIYSLNELKLKNNIALGGTFLKFSKDGHLMYTKEEKSHGLLVSDILDVNNPEIVQIYKSFSYGVYNFTLSQDEKKLYIAFGAGGLGIVD